MRVGMVGGVERNEGAYREVAERSGWSFTFHSGHLGGRGTVMLADLVRGCHLVVVVTEVNSHNAVQMARRLARQHGVSLELVRRCSPGRLAALLWGRNHSPVLSEIAD